MTPEEKTILALQKSDKWATDYEKDRSTFTRADLRHAFLCGYAQRLEEESTELKNELYEGIN